MSDSCSLISESDYPLTNWIEESSDCLSEGNLEDKQTTLKLSAQKVQQFFLDCFTKQQIEMSRMHEESLANEKPLDTKYVRVLICGTINSDGSLQEHYSCSDSNKEPEKEEVLAKEVAQFVDTIFYSDTHCENIHLKVVITYLSQKAPYPLYEEGRNIRLWVWDLNVQRNEPISVQEILPDSSVIV